MPFDQLIDRTVSQITSTRLTDDVLKHLGLTRAMATAAGCVGEDTLHWVEVAVVCAPGVTNDLANEMMPALLEYHKNVAIAMAGHVRATAANINRSLWLSGGILSKSPEIARELANRFREHLLHLTANQRNKYETAFMENETLMQQLTMFANTDPPTLLWRGHGQFADLFRFLAPRFLAAPDNVLDAEGVHARWKWIETVKRNITLKMLNAMLKTHAHLQHHGVFPDPETFTPYVRQVREGLRLQYINAIEVGVPARARSNAVYANRFNIAAADIELLRTAAATEANRFDTDADVALSNYIRFLLEPGHFYVFQNLNPELFLFVARNRAAPGRDMPKDGLAQGARSCYVYCSCAQHDHVVVALRKQVLRESA
jgi:hypothetical protein